MPSRIEIDLRRKTRQLLKDESESRAKETFATLWMEALRKFQQGAADVLGNRWESLIDRLSGCSTTDDVLAILDESTSRMKHFHAGPSSATWRTMRTHYLKPAIQVLLRFNDAIAEMASHFPVVPGGKAIFVAFGVLLEATDGVNERCEALIGLFEELDFFLGSLRIRLATPTGLGPATKTIAITILAHLLDIFSIATKLFTPSAWRTRLALYKQALVKDRRIRDALDRLHTLGDLEVRAIAAETQFAVDETKFAAQETQVVVEEMQAVVEETQVAVENTQAAVEEAQVAVEETQSIVNEVKALVEQVISEIRLMRGEISHALQEALESGSTNAQQLGPDPQHTAAGVAKLLKIINRVHSADIDAQNSNGCLEGTRANLMTELLNWSRDSSAPRIYWLNGMAGVGKSAIARSFSRKLRELGLLGGSFFCSRRGVVEQADSMRIIPTLAVSMGLRDSHCTLSLLAELDANPFSPLWNYEVQVAHLLSKPFSGIHSSEHPLPVMVVDALDECSDPNATHELLVELVKSATNLPVKFFLTSRPEPHIRHELENMLPALGRVLRLHDVEADAMAADISLYLRHGLQKMRKTLPSSTLDWPLQAHIDRLTFMSGRLFIYAFTALMYVQRNPVERLARLTGALVTAGPILTRPLDDIYTLILSEAMNPLEYEEDEIRLTGRVIFSIVHLRDSLTVEELALLLNMSTLRLRGSLDRLYAVIYVPVRDDEGFLTTFHASFGDFLTTPGRAPEHIQSFMPSNGHTLLAEVCLQMMQSNRLCFNVSKTVSSYEPNIVSKTTITRIDHPLRYACIHWWDHLIQIPQDSLEPLLQTLELIFVGPKFLFWLEALAAMGIYDAARNKLQGVISILHNPKLSRLAAFMRDASEFAENFEHVIIQSIPHLYLSALAFCDRTSAVRETCLPFFPNLAREYLRNPAYPYGGSPTSATFTSDGRQIIVGFNNGTIRTWDTETGAPSINAFSSCMSMAVSSITISPDDRHIVCGFRDYTVRIWDMVTSTMTHVIPVEGWVYSLTFSPDGSLFAFGSSDNTIRILDAGKGAQLSSSPLIGHSDTVLCVSYSPDGRRLVSGSRDGAIRLWNVNTGSSIHKPMKIAGPTQWIVSVAFKPNGDRVMSSAFNGIVCVWCAETGVLLSVYDPQRCCAHWVHSSTPTTSRRDDADSTFSALEVMNTEAECECAPIVDCVYSPASSFASDGRRVIMSPDDHSVRIWDLETLSLVCEPLQGHSREVTFVGSSRDDHRVVSCANDCTIRIWNTDTGIAQDERQRYKFSPDMSCALQDYPITRGTPTSANSSSQRLPTWMLTIHGWIVDVSCQPPRLLLWIPHHLREGLYIPPTSLIIAPIETQSLDLSNFAHGTRWLECYRDHTVQKNNP